MWVIVEKLGDSQGGWASEPLGKIYGMFKDELTAKTMMNQLERDEPENEYEIKEVNILKLPSNINQLKEEQKLRNKEQEAREIAKVLRTQTCQAPIERNEHHCRDSYDYDRHYKSSYGYGRHF